MLGAQVIGIAMKLPVRTRRLFFAMIAMVCFYGNLVQYYFHSILLSGGSGVARTDGMGNRGHGEMDDQASVLNSWLSSSPTTARAQHPAAGERDSHFGEIGTDDGSISDTASFPPVAVFYHVFISKETRKLKNSGWKIVKEQINKLCDSFLGAYDRFQSHPLNIYYTSINVDIPISFMDQAVQPPSSEVDGDGNAQPTGGAMVPKSNTKQPIIDAVRPNVSSTRNASNIHFHHLQHLDVGYEEVTIRRAYDYCSRNSDHRVVYMHNKGSYHNNKRQSYWRRHMLNAVASRSCVATAQNAGCNVCGLLWLPRPGIHLTGNFWNAQCSYINQLIAPDLFEARMNEVIAYVRKLVDDGMLQWELVPSEQPWNLGIERYAMEHWIGSHPSLKACDVSPTPSITYWKTTKPKDINGTGYVWGMFPRHVVDAPWSHGGQHGISAILDNDVARQREFFLLPGQLIKWLLLYQQVPEDSSWVWSWYPDGLMWRDLVKQHGLDAISIHSRKLLNGG